MPKKNKLEKHVKLCNVFSSLMNESKDLDEQTAIVNALLGHKASQTIIDKIEEKLKT